MASQKQLLLEKIPPWLAFSPYAVAVCALVLTACVVVYSLHNVKRESDVTTQLMLEKGEALLLAVQGVLQSRRNGQWLSKELQELLEDVGAQNTVRYLGLMDNCGVQEQSLIAGSSLNREIPPLDMKKLQELPPGSETRYYIQPKTADSGALFVVYKSVRLDYFERGRKHGHGGRGMHGGGQSQGMGQGMRRSAGNAAATSADQAPEAVLAVAYDLTPLEEAQATDRRHSAIMIFILVFLGLVGLLFLYFVRLHTLSRKRVEEANTLLLRQERLAALGTMAAGVAHEVRNPLSSISGAARIIQEAHPTDSEEHSLAQLIGQEVRRLDKVVGDLLDVARQDTLQVQPFALHTCVDKARTMLHAEMEQQKVQFSSTIIPSDLQIRADYDRLLQVWLNLFLNALQAMPQGGQLRFTARREGAAGDKASTVVMQVIDSGCGMPAEALEHIFSPYFTGKAQGTGLGLSIVHKIVQAHGGTISVRSTVGAGTEFCLVLPE